MTRKVCADQPDQLRRAKNREAMDDIAIIAQILQAIGGSPTAIEGAVVAWLGKRLYFAYDDLEHRD